MSDTQFRKQLLNRYRNCKPPVTPTECQGQMAEYSYTSDGEYVFVQIVDHSEKMVLVEAIEFTDNIQFDPWNTRPENFGGVQVHLIFNGPIGEDR